MKRHNNDNRAPLLTMERVLADRIPERVAAPPSLPPSKEPPMTDTSKETFVGTVAAGHWENGKLRLVIELDPHEYGAVKREFVVVSRHSRTLKGASND